MQLAYVVFDAPMAGGGIQHRLQIATAAIPDGATNIHVHPHTQCTSEEHLLEELARVEALGGEGLMLRHRTAPHRGGRIAELLKVKTFQDDEVSVSMLCHAMQCGARMCHVLVCYDCVLGTFLPFVICLYTLYGLC